MKLSQTSIIVGLPSHQISASRLLVMDVICPKHVFFNGYCTTSSQGMKKWPEMNVSVQYLPGGPPRNDFRIHKGSIKVIRQFH